MRRPIAFILLFILPLQFAWSSMAGVHGHMDDHRSVLGLHACDHGDGNAHPDGGPTDEGQPSTAGPGEPDKAHGVEGQPAGHYHPAFSMIPMDIGTTKGLAVSGGSIPHRPPTFATHIPPLLDRPPLASA